MQADAGTSLETRATDSEKTASRGAARAPFFKQTNLTWHLYRQCMIGSMRQKNRNQTLQYTLMYTQNCWLYDQVQLHPITHFVRGRNVARRHGARFDARAGRVPAGTCTGGN